MKAHRALLIDMLAVGMIIPVLPMLVQNFVGGNAARAAAMYGLFGTAPVMRKAPIPENVVAPATEQCAPVLAKSASWAHDA
jgi:hypothetical protein